MESWVSATVLGRRYGEAEVVPGIKESVNLLEAFNAYYAFRVKMSEEQFKGMRKEVLSKLEGLKSSESIRGTMCFTYDSKYGYAEAAASGYDKVHNIAVVIGVNEIVSEATKNLGAE